MSDSTTLVDDCLGDHVWGVTLLLKLVCYMILEDREESLFVCDKRNKARCTHQVQPWNLLCEREKIDREKLVLHVDRGVSDFQ